MGVRSLGSAIAGFALIVVVTSAFATSTAVAAAATQPAEATFLYVSANRVMEYDAANGTSTALEYIQTGTPIMPARALGGAAVSCRSAP